MQSNKIKFLKSVMSWNELVKNQNHVVNQLPSTYPTYIFYLSKIGQFWIFRFFGVTPLKFFGGQGVAQNHPNQLPSPYPSYIFNLSQIGQFWIFRLFGGNPPLSPLKFFGGQGGCPKPSQSTSLTIPYLHFQFEPNRTILNFSTFWPVPHFDPP